MLRLKTRLSGHVLPCPIQIMVGTDKTMASIINNQEMAGSRVFNVLRQLHREFDVWVGATGYAPRLGSKIVSLAKDLEKTQKVVLRTQVIFPAKQEGRYTIILSSICLVVDE